MDFRGLDDTTIDNGRALNASFLALATGPAPPRGLEPGFVERLRQLDATPLERLANTPFLLFTIAAAEAVPGASRPLRGSMELLDEPMNRDEARLVAGTLSLLWSLARTDRHAARFLAGTSSTWCDDIAGTVLMDVLETTRRFETLVVPRSVAQRGFWDKLFVSACDRRSCVRRAAQQSALQCVLTEVREDAYDRVAVAACRKRVAVERVAE